MSSKFEWERYRTHFKVYDRSPNVVVAVCFDEENAQDIVDALNHECKGVDEEALIKSLFNEE